jgi:hypothetical protein
VPVIVADEQEIDELPDVIVMEPDVPVNEPPLLRQLVAPAVEAIAASIATAAAARRTARMDLWIMVYSYETQLVLSTSRPTRASSSDDAELCSAEGRPKLLPPRSAIQSQRA